MTESIVPAEASDLEQRKPRWFDQLTKRLLFRLLNGLRRGELTIVDGSVRHIFGAKSEQFPLGATISVHDPRFYSSVVFGGSIGASEAFMAGQWSTDDLTTVVRITILNQKVFEGLSLNDCKIAARQSA